MEESNKRARKKGLVVVLLVLVLVIISLSIGIAAVVLNNHDDGQEITDDTTVRDTEKTIAEYQTKIDETSGEEKIELYLERFDALVDIMNQSGQDLCMQVMSDAGVVMDNVDQDTRLAIFETIPEDCMATTEMQETNVYSESGEEDV